MNKRITYQTCGTCCKFIDVEVDEQGVLTDVNFIGGCHGNLQGICSLVRGMKTEDIKKKLSGICCGHKDTSCPDQLCKAIEKLEATT